MKDQKPSTLTVLAKQKGSLCGAQQLQFLFAGKRHGVAFSKCHKERERYSEVEEEGYLWHERHPVH